MAIGPVQLIVLGFEQPDFHGEIIAELERLRESDTVRVIDALAAGGGKWPRVRLRAIAESSALPTTAPTQSGFPCASATSARGVRAACSACKRDFRLST
jgi:hypothetical protein